MLEDKIIEIAPLGYMRGRTFKNCWIVADEMQNSTISQMKMLLTRVGFGSKVVITGDVSQIDVPDGRSGLVGLEKKLGHIDSLAFVYLDGSDVVRHRIVADIVAAYERFTNAEARRSSARKAARDG